uniref:Uncharacterized protein n=1 Tax=Arundo donax TaxID=35708 RepID=A0A0A9ASJ6_ARUDO
MILVECNAQATTPINLVTHPHKHTNTQNLLPQFGNQLPSSNYKNICLKTCWM